MRDVLRDYIRKVSDEDLRYLSLRLAQRIGEDVAEAVILMQRNADMDHWLSSGGSAEDFFDMIDQVDMVVQQEIDRRF